MKIVITGNLGYVGAALVSHLRVAFPGATITGIDSGLFAHCTTQGAIPERAIDVQLFRDVRDVEQDMLSGADVVVHLAAISNDPMGLRFEAVTEDVNQMASIRVAEMAARCGVKRFVFASSCSIYGFADGNARSEDDALNPLTAYARSKAGAEIGLKRVSAESDMLVTALRFATACGFSGRTRLDLVLNDFVASALSTKQISVLSDGTPWRPLIHLKDMVRAIEWSIVRPAANDGFVQVNVGNDEWNYQVSELAEAVQSLVPGTTIDINKNAQPDKRSYRVDFARFKSIAPGHQPLINLHAAIIDIRDGLLAMGFDDPNYRKSNLIRFNVLDEHLSAGRLQSDLRWSTYDNKDPKDSFRDDTVGTANAA